MRRRTHAAVGAAVVLPLVLSSGPGLAAGCLWFAVAGAGLPDWLDLRSEFRTSLRLRHRGASHGVFSLALCAGIAWGLLRALQGAPVAIGDMSLAPQAGVPDVLALALALGFASHLAADACTPAGIQPLLPFFRIRVWLLPRLLRGRTGGPLDAAVQWFAITALAFGLVIAAGRWLDLV